ncbi:MAG: hypothetical protein ABII21_04135 [bacterium]
MEETIQNQPITQTLPTVPTEYKSQLFTFISILVAVIVSGSAVYLWQSSVTRSTISQLQSQIDGLQNQLSQSQSPAPVAKPPASSAPSSTTSVDKTAGWQIHMDSTNAYSIKYPKGWRKVDFGKGSIGVGPADVGEDVKWALNVYDSSATTIDTIISDMGKQFSDRNEKREDIVIYAGGTNIKAIKVTVTTAQYRDWSYEAVIFESAGKIFSVNNGAIIDPNFELFYNSFTRL